MPLNLYCINTQISALDGAFPLLFHKRLFVVHFNIELNGDSIGISNILNYILKYINYLLIPKKYLLRVNMQLTQKYDTDDTYNITLGNIFVFLSLSHKFDVYLDLQKRTSSNFNNLFHPIWHHTSNFPQYSNHHIWIFPPPPSSPFLPPSNPLPPPSPPPPYTL